MTLESIEKLGDLDPDCLRDVLGLNLPEVGLNLLESGVALLELLVDVGSPLSYKLSVVVVRLLIDTLSAEESISVFLVSYERLLVLLAVTVLFEFLGKTVKNLILN